MFEGLLSSIICRYASRYVDCLDEKHMHLSIWKGEVDLKDVNIKPSVFEDLDVPLSIKSFNIGNLFAKVDWKKLGSEPIIVSIDDVVIVAETPIEQEYDEETMFRKMMQLKAFQLDLMESICLAHEHEALKTPSYLNWFGGQLLAKMFSNFQLHVGNIKIQYTPQNLPKDQFNQNLDILIKNISIGTEKLDVKHENQNIIFKALNVSGIAMTMHYVEPLPMDPVNQNQIDYFKMLLPVDVKLILGIPSDLLSSTASSVPTYIQLLSTDIDFGVTQEQVAMILSQYSAIKKYMEFQAAQNKKYSQKFFRSGTPPERLQYVELYKRTLNALWLPELTEEEANKKLELEKTLLFEDIAVCRAVAIAELRVELDGKPVKQRFKAETDQSWLVKIGLVEEEHPHVKLTRDKLDEVKDKFEELSPKAIRPMENAESIVTHMMGKASNTPNFPTVTTELQLSLSKTSLGLFKDEFSSKRIIDFSMHNLQTRALIPPDQDAKDYSSLTPLIQAFKSLST